MNWLEIFGGTLQQFIGRDAVIIAMAAIGLNIHFGYTGLLNFGQVAWMAVGSYAIAMAAHDWGWSLPVSFIFALGISMVFSVLMGIPTLRLRGDYLAIATVAASAIVKQVFKHGTWAGGGNGIFGPAKGGDRHETWSSGFFPKWVEDSKWDIGFTGFRLSAREAWLLGIAWGAVALAALLTYFIMRSPWGRVLRAIREDEDAARALGKNTFQFKMQSLILGGLFGSIAGVLLAVGTANANPEDFNPTQTYWAWAALIVGGIAAPGGPLIGSMMFWGFVAFTEKVLQQARSADLIDFLTPEQIGQLRYILVGLGLVLMMVLRPEGVFGNKKEMSLDAR